MSTSLNRQLRNTSPQNASSQKTIAAGLAAMLPQRLMPRKAQQLADKIAKLAG